MDNLSLPVSIGQSSASADAEDPIKRSETLPLLPQECVPALKTSESEVPVIIPDGACELSTNTHAISIRQQSSSVVEFQYKEDDLDNILAEYGIDIKKSGPKGLPLPLPLPEDVLEKVTEVLLKVYCQYGDIAGRLWVVMKGHLGDSATLLKILVALRKPGHNATKALFVAAIEKLQAELPGISQEVAIFAVKLYCLRNVVMHSRMRSLLDDKDNVGLVKMFDNDMSAAASVVAAGLPNSADNILKMTELVRDFILVQDTDNMYQIRARDRFGKVILAPDVKSKLADTPQPLQGLSPSSPQRMGSSTPPSTPKRKPQDTPDGESPSKVARTAKAHRSPRKPAPTVIKAKKIDLDKTSSSIVGRLSEGLRYLQGTELQKHASLCEEIAVLLDMEEYKPPKKRRPA